MNSCVECAVSERPDEGPTASYLISDDNAAHFVLLLSKPLPPPVPSFSLTTTVIITNNSSYLVRLANISQVSISGQQYCVLYFKIL